MSLTVQNKFHKYTAQYFTYINTIRADHCVLPKELPDIVIDNNGTKYLETCKKVFGYIIFQQLLQYFCSIINTNSCNELCPVTITIPLYYSAEEPRFVDYIGHSLIESVIIEFWDSLGGQLLEVYSLENNTRLLSPSRYIEQIIGRQLRRNFLHRYEYNLWNLDDSQLTPPPTNFFERDLDVVYSNPDPQPSVNMRIKIREQLNSDIATKTDDNNLCCQLCMENISNIVSVPCGHLIGCSNCIRTIKCPYCRNYIWDIIIVINFSPEHLYYGQCGHFAEKDDEICTICNTNVDPIRVYS